MKRFVWGMLWFGVLCCKGQDAGLAWPQALHSAPAASLPAPDTIQAYPLSITERYTTNLLFPAAIFKVDIGTADVLARKMGLTENVLLLKAGRRGMASTNVSVYLVDGRLFSFLVSYADSLSSFNYSFCPRGPRALLKGMGTDKERLDSDAAEVALRGGRLKEKVSAGRVRLGLKGIFLKDGLMWLGLKAHNGSAVDFVPAGMRFSIEDRKKVRRTAMQSLEVAASYIRAGNEVLCGGMSMPLVAGLRPITVAKGKRLVVEWRENGNGRRLRLVIGGKRLLRAVKLG
jgi:conjugative transposon TraN protein